MNKLDQIRAKVRRVLVEEFGDLIEEEQALFVFECSEVYVSVRFLQHDPSNEEGRIFLEFAALADTVSDAADSLKSWIALEGANFLVGTFVLQPMADEIGVVFRYRILGDDVDPSEIYVASYAIAESIAMFEPSYR